MLEKKVVVGKIEVLEDGQIQLRTDTVILEGDVEISRLYHRGVLEPGQSITDQDARVQAIGQVVWTPEVVAEYRRRKAAQELGSRGFANRP